MSTEVIAPELESRALTLTEQAAGLLVTDAPSAQRAASFLSGVKGLTKEIEEFFRPLKQAQDAAKRKLLDAEKEKLAPLQAIETTIKGRISVWQMEEERRRREEERRLQEEARKAEEERRLAEAAALEAAGEKEAAAAVLEEAVVAPAPVVTLAAPKIEGMSSRTTHKAVVVDMLALVRHVAANPALVNLLLPNQVALNGQARSLGGAMKLPGVQVIAENVIASRRG